MATALSTFRSRSRIFLMDTETGYTYADAVIDAWTNASIDRIDRESPFILSSGNLSGQNGVLYQFDLATIFSKFLRLRAITPMGVDANPLTLHVDGMSYIRALEARSQIVAGTPVHYVSKGTIIVLDAIPATDLVITTDYWASPTVLSLDGDTPEGLLAVGWDDLILGMNKIGAGNDIPGELGDRLLAEGTFTVYGNKSRRIKGEMDKFEAWVLAELGHFADEAAAPYAEIKGGAPPARSVPEFSRRW